MLVSPSFPFPPQSSPLIAGSIYPNAYSSPPLGCLNGTTISPCPKLNSNFSTTLLLFQCFLSLPFLQSRIRQPTLNTFTSPLIHNKSIRKFCLFYLFSVSLTTCLHPHYHPGPNCHHFSSVFTPAMVACLPKSDLILSNLFFTLQSMCPYARHWNDFSLLWRSRSKFFAGTTGSWRSRPCLTSQYATSLRPLLCTILTFVFPGLSHVPPNRSMCVYHHPPRKSPLPPSFI